MKYIGPLLKHVGYKRPDIQVHSANTTGEGAYYSNGLSYEFDTRSSNRAHSHAGHFIEAHKSGTVVLFTMDKGMFNETELVEIQKFVKKQHERIDVSTK